MTKKTIKKTIAMLTTCAVLTTSCSLFAPLSASAASDVITGNSKTGKITINEGNIDTVVTTVKDTLQSLSGTINNYDASIQFDEIDSAILGRYGIYFTIKIDSTILEKEQQTILENVCLQVKSSIKEKGSTKSGYYEDYRTTVTYDKNQKTFKISGDLISFGTSMSIRLKFNTQNLSTPLRNSFSMNKIHLITTPELVGKNSNYKIVETTEKDTENVRALLPKTYKVNNETRVLTDDKCIKWIKRMYCFVNSLSEISGIDNKYCNILFDATPIKVDAAGWCYTYVDSPVLCIENGYTSDAYNSIYQQEDLISWVELHEISHAYSKDDYGFGLYYQTEIGAQRDDLTTNIRGITALQNCTNLNKTLVAYSNLKKDYRKIADSIANLENSYYWRNQAAFINFANQYNFWGAYESYFEGKLTYNGVNINTNHMAGALKAFQELTGIVTSNISPTATGKQSVMANYIRSLCFIYLTTYDNWNTTFNKESFKNFLRTYFNVDDLSLFAYKNNGGQFNYGDIENNGKIEITDITKLSLYLLGDASLSEVELIRADITRDGKVTSADLVALRAKI